MPKTDQPTDIRSLRAPEFVVRLVEEPSWMDAVVASTHEAIVSYGPDGRIRTWNPGAERLYGYRSAEAVGAGISLTAPADRMEELEEALSRFRAGEHSLRLETVRLTKNGTPLDVDLTLAPIRDRHGHMVGFAAVARDLTEQRWMAATLDRTIAKLESALAAAQHAEAASRHCLADVAHRLRSLSAGVQLHAEAVLRKRTQRDRETVVARILEDTAGLNAYVRRLLRMARLDAGTPLRPRPGDLAAVSRAQVELAAAFAPDLDVSLCAGPLPSEFVFDAKAVEEILENLLDNARRHAIRRIEVSAEVAGDTVEIRVVDDGPGMTEDVAARAFERFVSLDGKGGSGLGLAIARELARAHGGELSYEGPGRGFVLRLPHAAHRGSGKA